MSSNMRRFEMEEMLNRAIRPGLPYTTSESFLGDKRPMSSEIFCTESCQIALPAAAWPSRRNCWDAGG